MGCCHRRRRLPQSRRHTRSHPFLHRITAAPPENADVHLCELCPCVLRLYTRVARCSDLEGAARGEAGSREEEAGGSRGSESVGVRRPPSGTRIEILVPYYYYSPRGPPQNGPRHLLFCTDTPLRPRRTGAGPQVPQNGPRHLSIFQSHVLTSCRAWSRSSRGSTKTACK